jgi:hypothetical protein
VTRLAQELGALQAETATLRQQLETEAAASSALSSRLTALEAAMSEPADEVEEIEVPPAPAPSAGAGVPVAAKRERGLIARMFLGR